MKVPDALRLSNDFCERVRLMRSSLEVAILLSALFTSAAGAQESVATGGPPESTAGDELGQLRTEIELLKQRLDRPMGVFQAGPGRQPPFAQNGDSGAYAGYSLVFAKPHLKESFQATILDVPTGTLSLQPFEYDYEPSSRVWIGFQNESGIGLRAKYWHFDHNGDGFTRRATPAERPGAAATTVIYPANITTALPGDLLRVSNSLAAQSVDLEGTRAIALGKTELTASAGLRYAQLEQTYFAQVTSLATPGILSFSRNFYGLGPSIGVDARHPIGMSGISAVATFRGSFLFGQKTLERSVTGDVTPNAGPANVKLRNADEITGIYEAGLGAEWRLYSGAAGEFSLRGMYEGQLWTDGGAPTITFLGFEGFSIGCVWQW